MDKKTCKVWNEYEKALNYQKNMGFTEDFPMYQRFKEGDQWPPATKKTKHLPRPVFNITEMFIKAKRASVTNQKLIINFKPAEAVTDEEAMNLALQGAKDYTDFTKILWEEMDHEELLNEMVDDAATNGTGNIHYYWDNDVAGGGSKKFRGDLRGEVIDTLDIFFGNPQIRDVQKQPWVIIRTRENVKAVKEFAKRLRLPSEDIELITPDNRESNYSSEHDPRMDEETVTVLTKYYRKNGEVVYDKVTKVVELITCKSLTPSSNVVEEEHAAAEEDVETTGVDTPEVNETLAEEEFKITLYPIVSMSWRKRKKCIYGIGDAKEIVTVNKAYNFLRAMQLLTVQDVGWPKTVIKKGAVEGEITNEPGEIIYEKEPNAIRYLPPPSSTGLAQQLANDIFEISRTLSGVTEVSTGEVVGANMAASAIIALQNQAKTPIREIQKRYFNTIKKIGAIFEEFYKTYYSLPRMITTENEEGKEESREFNGSTYQNISFKMVIDVGGGSEYGEELTMSTLDKLYDKGEVTTDQYLELAPQTVVPFKEQLKKMRSENTLPSEVLKIINQSPQLRETVISMCQGGGVGGQGMQMLP